MKIQIAERLATLSNAEDSVKGVAKLIQNYSTNKDQATDVIELVLTALKDFIFISTNLEFQAILSRYLGYLYVLHQLLMSTHVQSPLIAELVGDQKLLEIIDQLLRKHRRFLISPIEVVVQIWKEKGIISEELHTLLRRRLSAAIYWPPKVEKKLKCAKSLKEVGLTEQRDQTLYQRLVWLKKKRPDLLMKMDKKAKRIERANETTFKMLKCASQLQELVQSEQNSETRVKKGGQLLQYIHRAQVQVKMACSEVVNLQKVAFEGHQILMNCMVVGRQKESEHIDELTVKPLPKRKNFFGLEDE